MRLAAKESPMTNPKRTGRTSAGFTLIELLVVLGILGVLAGVVAPPLRNYMRTYAIRSAADNVATEILTARAKAIAKNSNFGVSFVVLDTANYRFVYEDDMMPADGLKGARILIADSLSDPTLAPQLGPVKQLPAGIVFATTPNTTSGVRFTSLGAACDQSGNPASCPSLTGVVDPDLIAFNGSEYKVTLSQTQTGLFKTIRVTTGGRVYVKEDYEP
jgi:prepilin-type N-terminal cleavage/methylation domain-containing protein